MADEKDQNEQQGAQISPDAQDADAQAIDVNPQEGPANPAQANPPETQQDDD